MRPNLLIHLQKICMNESCQRLLDSNTHLSVKHFVSDRKDDRKDTAGKFLESLEKLMTFLNSNPHKSTQGTIEFKDLYTRKHYPGLGFCKKVSMKHHIELLSDIV